MILFEIKSKTDLAFKFDFQESINKLSIQIITKKKTKIMKEILRQERKLNYESIFNMNPIVANVFSIIISLIKTSFFTIKKKI